MRIGIISDTHDHHANVLKAIEIFNDRQVTFVFHAGDIVSPFTARSFEKLVSAKFIAVFGNNEGEKTLLRSVVAGFGGEIHEDCYKGEIAGKRIFMTHTPHYLDEVTASKMYDLVIYGHTHVMDIHHAGKTMIINPGEATDWLTNSPQVVILDTTSMEYEVVALKA